MTAIQKLEPQSQEVAEVRDISGGLLEVIARAARDPNVDIVKMERLLEMQERVQDRNAKAEYIRALAAMQSDLPIIGRRGGIKDRAGNVQSTYALWEDINEAIKPIMKHYGFALSFKTRRNDAEITVTGILSHTGGHSEETELSLPTDTSGSKNAVQAVGSSTQYGKRYTAQALLNLTSRGEDDDGKAGGAGKTLSREQADKIQARADLKGISATAVCKLAKVDAIPDILAKDFDGIMRELDLAKSRIK